MKKELTARDIEANQLYKMTTQALLGILNCQYRVNCGSLKTPKTVLVSAILDAKFGREK
jgi:hypothetical protein